MSENQILEGFLCPICKKDLGTQFELISHFESAHTEDQDVLKSLFNFVGTKAKKILNLDDKDLESFKSSLENKKILNNSYLVKEEQTIGVCRDHSDYFKSIRANHLEHFSSEINKLLIRLDKLINIDSAIRKHQEQNIVKWIDGTDVKLCPDCAKAFNLTRRQHHCRLCGSIMCHFCSNFITISKAKEITFAVLASQEETSNEKDDIDTIRICKYCLKLLEIRYTLQKRKNHISPITDLYDRLHSLIEDSKIKVEQYQKMHSSLISGETKYNLLEVNQLRSNIGKNAEEIDSISKKLIRMTEHLREMKLLQSIRNTSAIFLKHYILTLPQLPTQEYLESLKSPSTPEENLARNPFGEWNDDNLSVDSISLLNGWSPLQSVQVTNTSETDPLLVQMNVIRGYIKEARNAGRYEEMEILEKNLRELQTEYYNEQQKNSSENMTS